MRTSTLADLPLDAPVYAVRTLYASFPATEVDLYLVSLLAIDRGTWGALAPILARQTASA